MKINWNLLNSMEQWKKEQVLKFSPLNPDNSERYNLLTNCKTNAEVIELASMLLYKYAFIFNQGGLYGNQEKIFLE